MVPDDMVLYCGILRFEELNRLDLERFPSEFVLLCCCAVPGRIIEVLVPQPSLKRVNHGFILVFPQQSIAELVSQDGFVSQPVLSDYWHQMRAHAKRRVLVCLVQVERHGQQQRLLELYVGQLRHQGKSVGGFYLRNLLTPLLIQLRLAPYIHLL